MFAIILSKKGKRKGDYMDFLVKLYEFLTATMETPKMYGTFHVVSLVVAVLAGVLLCILFKNPSKKFMRIFLLATSLFTILFEVYRQLYFTYSLEDGVFVADYAWYQFPYQFCATPMYVGLLAAIIGNEKIHDALCSYLVSFAPFAGLCVMLYPVDIFVEAIGINYQTVFCHGSMISIAIFLVFSGYVKVNHKTVLKAIPIFAFFIITATIMNEIAFYSGLLETDTFNMFFISRHLDSTLPVYSMVHAKVPYPFSVVIYVVAFSAAAYIMTLLEMAGRKLLKKKA